MPVRRPTALAALSAAALLTLGGCTAPAGVAPAPAQPPAQGAGQPAGTTSAPAQPAQPAAPASVDASSAAQAGIDPANPPQALATATVTTALDPKSKLKVDLVGFQRHDKVVVAVFGLTIQGDGPDGKYRSLFQWLGNAGAYPYAVDPVNLKRHGVVKAGTTELRSDSVDLKVTPGGISYYHAVFAAPPPEVKAMDVAFADAVPMFAGVPLS